MPWRRWRSSRRRRQRSRGFPCWKRWQTAAGGLMYRKNLRPKRQNSNNLLALYQEALVAEDSDRLQALLAPATARAQAQTTADRPPRQDPTGAFTDLTAFQEALRATFQQAHRHRPRHPA